VAFAHISATAALGVGLGHLVFAATGSAVLAAGGSFLAAVSFGRFVFAAARGAIFAASSAFFATVALGHLVFTATGGPVLTAGGAIFAAGSCRLGGGLVSGGKGRVLRPHTDGE
jgi:hypothetical protein